MLKVLGPYRNFWILGYTLYEIRSDFKSPIMEQNPSKDTRLQRVKKFMTHQHQEQTILIVLHVMESVVSELFEQEEVIVKITAGEVRSETD